MAQSKHTRGRAFNVTYQNEPWRNRQFEVRGVCRHDVLNPCWDNRPDDVAGKHWGGGLACEPCTRAAIARAEGGAT